MAASETPLMPTASEGEPSAPADEYSTAELESAYDRSKDVVELVRFCAR
jgi:hypothetical protein